MIDEKELKLIVEALAFFIHERRSQLCKGAQFSDEVNDSIYQTELLWRRLRREKVHGPDTR
jgi:hypothetical protein